MKPIIYETHKWLGIWALVFASYHFVFKANLNVWHSVPILASWLQDTSANHFDNATLVYCFNPSRAWLMLAASGSTSPVTVPTNSPTSSLRLINHQILLMSDHK
jgi:hypothetical protein